MKKINYVEKLEPISIDEAVKYFCENYDIDDPENEISYYIENDLKEVSKEEEQNLRAAIKCKCELESKKLKEEAKNQLKNRKSILKVIKEYIIDNADVLEDIGFHLSEEEILELILLNGNK